jgi:glycerol-3-phosphate dehydrogenase (NAD(P)+)
MQIGVIGAGSWGTTLAIHLNRLGHRVVLWIYEQELYEAMTATRENPYYFPGHRVDTEIELTTDLDQAVRNRDSVFFVVPSQFFRRIVEAARPFIGAGQVIVSATKGIENGSLMTMSQILYATLGDRPSAVLSGPSFAREVALGLPTAVTIASAEISRAVSLQNAVSSDSFRVYAHDDVIGTELGGAVKNLIAIAAGISDGLGFGLNARAALITRGLAEMIKLGTVMGADPMTFAGLSGLGDLVLTCTGDLSRNRTVGLRIGQGQTIERIQREMKSVAEGVETTLSLKQLAEKRGIEMPITEQVYRVLYEKKDPRTAVVDLMTRSLKKEIRYRRPSGSSAFPS